MNYKIAMLALVMASCAVVEKTKKTQVHGRIIYPSVDSKPCVTATMPILVALRVMRSMVLVRLVATTHQSTPEYNWDHMIVSLVKRDVLLT